MKGDFYYCNCCGAFLKLEELDTRREVHGELDSNDPWNYETWLVCPNCQSDELEDAYACEICGEPTLTEICDHCKETLIEKFNEFKDKVCEEMHIEDTDIFREALINWIEYEL